MKATADIYIRKVKKVIKNSLPSLILAYDRIASYKEMFFFSFFSTQEVFTYIHNNRYWGSEESVSGPSSTLAATERIRAELPVWTQELGVKTFLDIPCGDLNWMKEVSLGVDMYIGADIVEGLIRQNIIGFSAKGKNRRKFIKLDITKDSLPAVDLIFSRDCLVHLSFKEVQRAIDNFKRSNSKYLVTTTFPDLKLNRDIVTGSWRPLNLQLIPLNFPPPLRLINEGCKERQGKFADKSLGLWSIASLP